MLAQETQEQLSKYGFDVSALTTAITSEEEVKLDVPELYKEKGLTNEDMTVFGNNRFKEGQTSNEEILAKQLHDEYGLELPDGKEGRKNIKKVFEAFGEKKFNEAKPSDDSKELLNNFKALQSKYTELEGVIESRESEFENRLFQTSLRQTLTSAVPKDTAIAGDKAVSLYLMENTIEKDGSLSVVKVDGEIQKDHLLNPVSVDTHFKTWLDSSGLVKKQGMNGKESTGSTSQKFSSISEFTTWCEKNGHEPMSDEWQKYYINNKA